MHRIWRGWPYAFWRVPSGDNNKDVVPEYQVVEILHQKEILSLVCGRHFVEWQTRIETQIENADIGSCPDDRLDCHCDTLAVSYTHLRAHETRHDLVCRLL